MKTNWITGLKKINWSKDKLLLTLLGGVLLLVISIPVKDTKADEKEEHKILEEDAVPAQYSVAYDNYGSYIEEKIEEVLSLAEGVGKVKVFVTFKNSGEIVLKSDTKNSNNTVTEEDGAGGSRITTEISEEVSVVYSKESNGSTIPYAVDRLSPEIEGVIVIAEGGSNPQVQEAITKAMEAVFGITANKIKVMKMEE